MANGIINKKPIISGTITTGNFATGKIASGGGSTDHNRLINREAENQHPIEAITDLREILDSKADSEVINPIVEDLIKYKARGLYFDEAKELADKSYWYLTAQIDPKTNLGTKESIISGPYDFALGLAYRVEAAGIHSHSVSSTIEANKVVSEVLKNSAKLNISTEDTPVIKSYPGVTSNLNTTTITGVSGNTTASKASVEELISVAKVGEAVTYGTADCDTAITGVAKVGDQILYGNANVGSATTVATGLDGIAYSAAYNETDECLAFTALSVNTTSITPAAMSSTTAYTCKDNTGISIIPAKESTKTLTPAIENGTITQYSFSDIIVPTAASTATTVATGSISPTGTGSSLLVSLGTAETTSVLTSANLITNTSGIEVITDINTNKDEITISGTTNLTGTHVHNIK